MTKLAKGQTVTVNVSGGTGQLAVPNVVIGQTTEAAQTFLVAEPYKFVVTVTPEPSATVAKGIVIRTDPVQGTLVDAASPITIFVSSGPAPVAMPNVKGQTEAAARDALTKIGLTATVEYVDLAAGNANVGKVIAQDTAAASMVNPGAAVVITVGRDTPVTTVAPAGATKSLPIAAILPSFVLYQLIDGRGAQYDTRNFNWLGSSDVDNMNVYVWHAAPVKSVEDAKRTEVLMGGTGAGSYTILFPTLMNNLIGTKFKIGR
jgi:hypothetical protein